MELKGTVGIVTGASRGLGVYIAERLAAKGADLALAARSADDLEATAELVRSHGKRAITVATDVTKNKDLQNLVDRTTAELGPIDLLVNNAGIEKVERFEQSSPADIQAILHTNVFAVELLTRFVVAGMIERKRGHILNIASAAGKTAVPYNTVYSSSKHAVVGFSWSLREELRPHGIGVSVVCPGFVRSAGMFSGWNRAADAPGIAGTVGPEKVAQKTIDAIEKNRAEVIVSGGLGRMVDVFNAVSPDATAFIARRSGFYDFLEEEASTRG
jgi:short-subunit dehydrogenase